MPLPNDSDANSRDTAPCSRVPDEILLHIFLYDKPTTAIAQVRQFFRSKPVHPEVERKLWSWAMSWVNVLHVCQRWRRVALSFGPMWTEVMCSHRLDMTDFMLQHSKGLPLTVSYSGVDSDGAAVTKLLSQVHRIEELHVTECDDGMVAELSTALSSPGATPILQVLILSPMMPGESTTRRVPVLDDRLFAVLPLSTTTLMFTGELGTIIQKPALTNLTDLSAVIFGPSTLSDSFALLNRLPHMKALSLSITGSVTIDHESYDAVHLHHLQVFVWNRHPRLLPVFFRTVQLPLDVHFNLTYAVEDLNIRHAFSFIRRYQDHQRLSFPRVNLTILDMSSGDNLERKGDIVLSLHPSFEISPPLQYTTFVPPMLGRESSGREQAGLYMTCHYTLSDTETFDLMLHELFKRLKTIEIQHFTFSVRFSEDLVTPLILPALKDLTGLTNLVLNSADAIAAIAASMEDALGEDGTTRTMVPSLRHLHIIGVPSENPSDDKDEPFNTLFYPLAIRAEDKQFLDTLQFTECGIHEATVSRFQEWGVAKEDVVWDRRSSREESQSVRSIPERLVLTLAAL